MDLTSGFPYSLVRYGLPYDYPALHKDVETDVVIIGAGISGALMAYHLANEGIKCIVIEGRTVGLGSTVASTSLLQYEIDTPLCRLQKKIGVQPANRAYKLCSAAIDKLEAIAQKLQLNQFERKKSLYYAEQKKDAAFLKNEFQARKAIGLDVEFLDEEAMKEYNFSAPAAILSAKGAQTNAYTFTHALLQYCKEKGISIFDRTVAEKISHLKEGVLIKTNKGYKVKAARIIYANGYEAVNYIDKKIVDLTSTYVVCSEQMEKEDIGLDTGTMLWSTGDPYLYMRTTRDNRILIGGRDDEFYSPAKRDHNLPKKAKQLQNDLKALFPKIPFNPEFSWAGTFGSTKDGLPYIGKYKKLDNSYFALGFGGNGIIFSLIAAEILSNELSGREKGNQLFSFDR